MPERPPGSVTASEIASYVFCPEAWRLAQLAHQPSNQAERDAGTVLHARTADTERTATAAITLGRVLIVIGLLTLGLYWVIHR
jgi:hypothetical protein